VPWKVIAGTRDKLIYFYQGVDLDEVWKMVISDLPQLIVVRIHSPRPNSSETYRHSHLNEGPNRVQNQDSPKTGPRVASVAVVWIGRIHGA
jgi:hypothetical protein